jgi:hypothetical protein
MQIEKGLSLASNLQLPIMTTEVAEDHKEDEEVGSNQVMDIDHLAVEAVAKKMAQGSYLPVIRAVCLDSHLLVSLRPHKCLQELTLKEKTQCAINAVILLAVSLKIVLYVGLVCAVVSCLATPLQRKTQKEMPVLCHLITVSLQQM